jgi:hypothetical protein
LLPQPALMRASLLPQLVRMPACLPIQLAQMPARHLRSRQEPRRGLRQLQKGWLLALQPVRPPLPLPLMCLLLRLLRHQFWL